jgi:hypothetical protein
VCKCEALSFSPRTTKKKKKKKKERQIAGCWWLTPVILATQEAEIRRIAVQSQPKPYSMRDPISKRPNTKQDWCGGSSDIAPA